MHLEYRKWKQVKFKGVSLDEKAAAFAVINTMEVKRKMGMSVKPQCRRGGALSFRQHDLLPISKTIKHFIQGKGIQYSAIMTAGDTSCQSGHQKSLRSTEDTCISTYTICCLSLATPSTHPNISSLDYWLVELVRFARQRLM